MTASAWNAACGSVCGSTSQIGIRNTRRRTRREVCGRVHCCAGGCGSGWRPGHASSSGASRTPLCGPPVGQGARGFCSRMWFSAGVTLSFEGTSRSTAAPGTSPWSLSHARNDEPAEQSLWMFPKLRPLWVRALSASGPRCRSLRDRDPISVLFPLRIFSPFSSALLLFSSWFGHRTTSSRTCPSYSFLFR